MLLKHAREPIDGQSIENTFEAIDERTGALLASCVIYTHMNEALYPTRPLRILLVQAKRVMKKGMGIFR